ncbi:GNAT family N-acetyltransferase [Pseudooceanicola sp. LIPI14-2-Ac024]|uniref:GNAT family N-acetyltransferase n=1 Tax=Pseudooceanicola sp. LIPI14-2-Ac024 TaxID=3344875 RepID=UPI0035CFBE52
MPEITIRPARPEEADALAELRVIAMRPSLEALGRFDPQRARARFLSGFVAGDTSVIRIDADLVGFYVLRRRETELYIDHLYVDPARQGTGLGRSVVASIMDEARSLDIPVRLMALKGSPANDFYKRHGFIETGSDAFDIFYEWQPSGA